MIDYICSYKEEDYIKNIKELKSVINKILNDNDFNDDFKFGFIHGCIISYVYNNYASTNYMNFLLKEHDKIFEKDFYIKNKR